MPAISLENVSGQNGANIMRCATRGVRGCFHIIPGVCGCQADISLVIAVEKVEHTRFRHRCEAFVSEVCLSLFSNAL